QPLSLTVWPDVSIGPKSADRTLLQDATLPTNMQGGFQLAVFSEFHKRAEAFRATMLRLALSDFHREHDRYPESLRELVPTYFAEVPLDPSTAGPFVYFPRGVPQDVTNGREAQQDFRIIVKKEVPFLVTFGGFGGTWRRSQLHNGSLEFTSDDGKRIDLSAVLRFARVWPLEKTPSSHE
ncbi:MAG TPA: hypothetical protein VK137_16985, partial [Planctomycetaceae bacterium]|nr:hypothetical protein [Planctomycetaceae bacterium]